MRVAVSAYVDLPHLQDLMMGCEVEKYTSQNWWHEDIDVHLLDRIIVPVHDARRQHWWCIDINILKNTIIHYDSLPVVDKNGSTMRSYYSSELDMVRQWLSDETARKRGEPQRWDTKNWEVKEGTCPRQYNGVDCGLFVTALMRCLATGRAFNYSHQDMDKERAHVAVQVLQRITKVD